MAEENGVGLHI